MALAQKLTDWLKRFTAMPKTDPCYSWLKGKICDLADEIDGPGAGEMLLQALKGTLYDGYEKNEPIGITDFDGLTASCTLSS